MSLSHYTFNGNAVSLALSIVIGISCAISLVTPSGYTFGFALVLLSSIPLLTWSRPAVSFSIEDGLLLGALVFYFSIQVIGNIVENAPLRNYDSSSRFLFSVFIFWVLRAYPIRISFWWIGMAMGAIAGGSFALWQVLVQGASRAAGFFNVAIQFGDICLLTGALSLAGIAWVSKRSYSKLGVVLFSVSGIMGFAGSLLSGARGGWLAIPCILVVLYISYGKVFSRRWFLGGVTCILILIVGLFYIPQSGVEQRFQETLAELKHYSEGTKVKTSVGMRLEMYKASLLLIKERPFLGWGNVGYKQPMSDLIEDAGARDVVSQFNHAHNELLDVLVKRGCVGLLAFLIVLIIPLVLAWRYIRDDQPEVQSFAAAQIILVLCVSIFGLTQVFFIHNSGVTIYAFYAVVLWSCLRNAQESYLQDETSLGRCNAK